MIPPRDLSELVEDEWASLLSGEPIGDAMPPPPRDARANADGPGEASPASWPPLRPFEDAEPPGYPIDVLPTAYREMVAAVAASTCTPHDLAGGMVLAVLASLAQRRWQAVVSADHREVLSLYVLIAMSSGERKSAVVRELVAPLWDRVRSERETLAPEIAEADLRRRSLEREIESLLRGGPKGAHPDVETAARRRGDLDALEVPEPRRLVIGDATPEALERELDRDPECCAAILSAEAALIGMLRGRYADSAGANLEVYLHAHVGESYTSHRISRESLSLESPRLTVGIAVQPIALSEMWTDRMICERGLEARFHVAVPASEIGRRPPRGPVVSEGVRGAYRRSVEDLCMEIAHASGLLALRCTEDARAALDDLHREIEPEMIGRLEPVRAYAAKLVGQAARFGGVLQIAEDPRSEAIDRDHAERGCQLARYYLAHRLRAAALLGAGDEGTARRILPWVLGRDRVTRRDIMLTAGSSALRISTARSRSSW